MAPPAATEPGLSSLQRRLAEQRPRSREQAERAYVVARDEWTAAMRAASSGRPADMAKLAIAQEAYESAAAERERWDAEHVAISVEPSEAPANLEIVVGQELEWRRVHDHEPATGLLGRVRRLLKR